MAAQSDQPEVVKLFLQKQPSLVTTTTKVNGLLGMCNNHPHHRSMSNCEIKICDKNFTSKNQLKNHIMIDHKEKEPFLCDICNITFSTKQNKNRHLLVVHDKNFEEKVKHVKVKSEFICEICFISFKNNLNFEEHMMAHDGQEPYKCDICESRCISEKDLKKHFSAIHVLPT